MSLVVESAGMTDVGQKRKGNEDSLFLDESFGLYVVADGMGGHLAGEVASRLVVETMADYVRRAANAGNDREDMAIHEPAYSTEANRLLSSVFLANQVVFEVSNQKKEYRGMGSTVSGVYLTQDTFVAVNVGDSPIYLVHDGEIETISVPHTVMDEQRAIDPEAADQLDGKFEHMLTRAMGVHAEVEPSISEIQCFAGDILVIGSDGLTNKVNDQEILEVVANNRADKACSTLVDMANIRGGEDNITVIVLKIKKVKHGQGILSMVTGLFKRQ